MKFAAVIDIAAFIWDEKQFKTDQTQFYGIIDAIPNILNMIVKEKIPVVFRSELFNEVKEYFPYNSVPQQFRDFRDTTIRQLTKLNIIEYPNFANTNITCKPSLIKKHFADSTKKELKYLISYLYQENERIHKLLTFKVFLHEHTEVLLQNGKIKKIDAEICDNEDSHRAIINSLKKIFEHNPKHRKVKRFFQGKDIAPLRCYNSRKKNDTDSAQKILDNSVYVENCYYGYDEDNKTYVRFLKTEKNFFHGFEVTPSNELKKKIENALKNG